MTPQGTRSSDWGDVSAGYRCFSEPCGAGRCGGVHGWKIPYHERQAGASVLVWVYVTDLSQGATFSKYLPLVVDTGSPVTVIPRRLLDDARAFARRDVAIKTMIAVGGSAVTGQMFPAALSINPRRPECGVLSFTPLPVFVADGPLISGLLGLDALRQISTTFDPSHARLGRV